MLWQRVFTATNTTPFNVGGDFSFTHRGDLLLLWRTLTAVEDPDAQWTCEVSASRAGVRVWREIFHAWPRSKQQPCNLTPSELYYSDWDGQGDETIGYYAWAAHPETQAIRPCRMWTFAPPGSTRQRWTFRTYPITIPDHDRLDISLRGDQTLMSDPTTGVIYLALFTEQ
jgi:hypothetical protein